MFKSLVVVSLLMSSARANPPAPYFAVLAGQPTWWQASADRDVFNEVSTTLGNFVVTKGIDLALGRHGKVEHVRQIFLRGELAMRRGANGRRELIGTAEFDGDLIPHSYDGDHAVLPFRLTLDASGQLVSFDFKQVDNTQLTVVQPSFESVTADQSRQITEDVAGFYRSAHATGDALDAALAGTSAKYRATVTEVRATAKPFGELGTIARVKTEYRPKPGVDGSSFNYVLDVIYDQTGKVIAIGTIW
jgi:hypothetical protein